MTVSPVFLAESPLKTARRYADMELKRQARPPEIEWLYAHPLMWLRALTRIGRDIENHIAKDRASIVHLKPKDGVAAGPEYLTAKAAVDMRAGSRLHVAQLAKNRIEEVKAILGPEPAIGYVSIGHLIGLMLELAEMADEGDLAAASDKARFYAKEWAARAKRGQP